MEKLKRKTTEQSVKAVRWKGWGLYWEGFQEKVRFEWKRVGMTESDSGDDNGSNEFR